MVATSTELASVAILHRGVLFTHQSSGHATHSATVLPMLQRALQEAGIALVDSVYSGPNYLKGDGELKHNAGYEGYITYKGIKDLTLWAGFAYDSEGNVIHKKDSILTFDFWAEFALSKDAKLAFEYATKDGGKGDTGTNWLVPGVLSRSACGNWVRKLMPRAMMRRPRLGAVTSRAQLTAPTSRTDASSADRRRYRLTGTGRRIREDLGLGRGAAISIPRL